MSTQADSLTFKKYSSSSNEINLHYNLDKYIPNAKHYEKINLDAYEHEFGSNINKDNFNGYITISKNSTFIEFKKLISEKTGFPVETMVGFGVWDGEECDESGKIWTNVNRIDIDENTLISNSRYNSPVITERYIYIYIDMDRDKMFSKINENQIKNDKKYKQLEEKEKENKKKITKLEQNLNDLKSENILM